jgi:hypothetical protein
MRLALWIWLVKITSIRPCMRLCRAWTVDQEAETVIASFERHPIVES